MKRILNIVFWIALPVTMLIMLGFVSGSQSELVCNNVSISIDHSNGMMFLNNELLIDKLKQTHVYPVGKKFKEIKIGEIEQVLLNISEVQDAEVYKTIDGNIGITVTQRTPIVRVLNLNGRQFYIDDRGYQMPISEHYYPRVLVVNGYISEPFVEESAYEIASDSSLRAGFKTDDVFAMASYISNDPFWSAQIQEIYFEPSGDMELIPVVGDHRIIFGDTTHLEAKFNKLKVFYQEGLRKTGWNLYDTINLKYKDQIVCSRK